MIEADFAVVNAGQLLTMAGEGPADLGLIEGGALAARGGRVVWVGPAAGFGSAVHLRPDATVLDASRRAVLPGFVDAHTHLVFAGNRADEFVARIAGRPYRADQTKGKGIMATVEATRTASEDELLRLAADRADSFLRHGTTTVEAKSGYGLDPGTELKILRVMRRLAAQHALEVVPTFLGAHALPPEYADRRGDYVDLVTETMLPEAAPLAEYCDGWCDVGAFTVEESRRILKRARGLGLGLRLHADELGPAGGAQLAAELRAASADHLLYVGAAGIAALARAGTVAVLCPGTALSLGNARYAPARELLEAGCRIAIASDFNPGTCYCENIQIAIALGCLAMRVPVEVAVRAATRGGAAALGRAGRIGTLQVGAQADLVLLAAQSYVDLAYHFGVNLVETVVKGGAIQPHPLALSPGLPHPLAPSPPGGEGEEGGA